MSRLTKARAAVRRYHDESAFGCLFHENAVHEIAGLVGGYGEDGLRHHLPEFPCRYIEIELGLGLGKLGILLSRKGLQLETDLSRQGFQDDPSLILLHGQIAVGERRKNACELVAEYGERAGNNALDGDGSLEADFHVGGAYEKPGIRSLEIDVGHYGKRVLRGYDFLGEGNLAEKARFIAGKLHRIPLG